LPRSLEPPKTPPNGWGEKLDGGDGAVESGTLAISAMTGYVEPLLCPERHQVKWRGISLKGVYLSQSIFVGPKPVILLVSTTGQGAFPSSANSLWKFLLRADLGDLLMDLPFAVFGLGDSTYPKFCWPAKKIDRRLEQLGAARLIERGEGDEQDYLGSVSVPPTRSNKSKKAQGWTELVSTRLSVLGWTLFGQC
jgi:flavodoxin